MIIQAERACEAVAATITKASQSDKNHIKRICWGYYIDLLENICADEKA